MIELKKITVKNFLSYGNTPTTVELDRHSSTLISAKNGSGKTAIIVDALCYSLFGKAFRKINKPALINSINGRDLLTELDFKVGSDQYKIIRGTKPEKFEIFKNTTLIDQEAASRDYQGYLEKAVLKMNFKTFSQILILSASNFTPFMQLPAGARREIIEDILDISIFTKMNRLLKEKIAVNRDLISKLELQIDAAKKETIGQRRVIEYLEKNLTNYNQDLKDDITKNAAQLSELELEFDSKQKQYKQFIELNTLFDLDVYDELKNERRHLEKTITAKEEQHKKFLKLSDCPVCRQGVSTNHKDHIGTIIADEVGELKNKINAFDVTLVELEKQYKQFQSNKLKAVELSSEIEGIERHITLLNNTIKELNEKLTTSKLKSADDIDLEKEKLKDIAARALALIEEKSTQLNLRSMYEVSLGLLRDTGIKSAIVKEYLPILNKLINRYLQEFDFFVNFELDENFNETIKSRGRDNFAYSSFSEGEKKRIDISILMAFRQITELKNSSRINILVCDEIDSGMDQQSMECFVGMMTKNMGGCSSWVISHVLNGTSMVDEFAAKAEVKKVGDFSIFTVL